MSAVTANHAATNASAEILIGRQPIFDRDLKVVGYELLFRRGDANQANVVDQDQATSQVIVNAFVEVGLANLVGDKLAYINIPAGFITGGLPIPFARDKAVLEILEHVKVNDAVVDAVRKFAKDGYTVALDDFVLNEQTQPLLHSAHIVKVDMMNADEASLREQVGRLLPYRVKLLAEKIETQQMFELCKKLGFELFQGYFLCRPNVVKGAQLPANRLQLLKLLSELNNPDVEITQVEKTIARDVGLSFKLLRVVNSAQYGIRKKVDSIKHAVVLLGIKTIKQWAMLITLAGIDDKPFELVVISLQRARFCQLLAQERGANNVDAYFTAGLFSTLEAMLDKPFPELLAQLSLSEELNQALLRRDGAMGEVLNAVIAFEEANWSNVALPGIGAPQLQKHYLDAVAWSRDAATQLSAAHAG